MFQTEARNDLAGAMMKTWNNGTKGRSRNSNGWNHTARLIICWRVCPRSS